MLYRLGFAADTKVQPFAAIARSRLQFLATGRRGSTKRTAARRGEGEGDEMATTKDTVSATIPAGDYMRVREILWRMGFLTPGDVIRALIEHVIQIGELPEGLKVPEKRCVVARVAIVE
jgi:antitoxin component of RelBE/YafQ-DinJ toxin-antitoxin module